MTEYFKSCSDTFRTALFMGVETKQLERQVRRNIDRFPGDFMFELNQAFYLSQKNTLTT
jgi:hypothetical protein